MGISRDGTEVVVTGGRCVGPGFYDYATIAYDASTGMTLWAASYNGTGNDFDEASSVGVSADGTEVFVTGQSTGSSFNIDYATIAYDASTGAKLWVKRYDGPGS